MFFLSNLLVFPVSFFGQNYKMIVIARLNFESAHYEGHFALYKPLRHGDAPIYICVCVCVCVCVEGRESLYKCSKCIEDWNLIRNGNRTFPLALKAFIPSSYSLVESPLQVPFQEDVKLRSRTSFKANYVNSSWINFYFKKQEKFALS